MNGLHVSLLIGLGVIVVGLALNVAGAAVPLWTIITVVDPPEKYEFGIFLYCVRLEDVHVCGDHLLNHNSSDKMNAIRAMLSLGALCALISIPVLVIVLVYALRVKRRPHKVLPFVALTLNIVSCLATFVGVAIYITVHVDIFKLVACKYRASLEFGYPFCLTVAGALHQLAGGILGFVSSWHLSIAVYSKPTPPSVRPKNAVQDGGQTSGIENNAFVDSDLVSTHL